MGLDHLMSLALDLGTERLQPFKQHFELLNVGTPLQNVAAARNDPSGDKVFELLIGLGAVRMSARQSLRDSPLWRASGISTGSVSSRRGSASTTLLMHSAKRSTAACASRVDGTLRVISQLPRSD